MTDTTNRLVPAAQAGSGTRATYYVSSTTCGDPPRGGNTIMREIARSSCGVIRDLTHSLRRRYAPPRAIPSSTPFAWHRSDNGSSSLRTHSMAIISAVVFVPSADVPLGSVNQSPSELRVSFIVDMTALLSGHFGAAGTASTETEVTVAHVPSLYVWFYTLWALRIDSYVARAISGKGPSRQLRRPQGESMGYPRPTWFLPLWL